MCDKCEIDVNQCGKSSLVFNHRKKLWQLDSSFHCSVVGTCLTLNELRQICKKLKITMPEKATDYDWHHSFVSIASGESHAARFLNKYLDKKYRSTVKQVMKLPADKLDEFWRVSLNEDNLPAAYWAVLTHAKVSTDLLDRMYGEVHMLSHLSGSSLRVDMEKLKRLELEKKRSIISIAENSKKTQKKLTEQSVKIHSLKQTVRKYESLKIDFQRANLTIEKLNNKSRLENFKQKILAIENKLASKIKHVHYLEKNVEQWKQSALECGDKLCLAEMQLQELRKENHVLEATLESYLSPTCSNCNNQDSCTSRGNLQGSCVLYVGGRDRQCVHFRSLVEENNGTFLHHDGGLNDGSQLLGSLLSKADMIFCPIDCISHKAVNRVKQFCGRTGKPLVLMRQASLSAFARGLNEVVS